MPHVVVHVSGPPDAAESRAIAAAVAGSITGILGKRAELIAIEVRHLDPRAWFIAGAALADQRRRAFHLDITVTDETNTKDEKARFIEAVYGRLAGILGELHECSYIHVIDARAAAYGYGGRTQEQRYVQASLARGATAA